MIQRILLLSVAVLFPLAAEAENPEYAASKSKSKVKVFILAGQSNMEGRGFPEPLTWERFLEPTPREEAIEVDG